MKRALLLALSLCLSVVSFAQLETAVPEDSPAKGGTGYMPVLKEDTISFNIVFYVTSKVTIEDYDPFYLCGETCRYTGTSADTVWFNGNKYRGFGSWALDSVYVREDTMTGRIYRYYPELDVEVMTCDMSLLEGDTFHLPNMMPYAVGVAPFSQIYRFIDYEETGYAAIVDSVTYAEGRKIIWFRPPAHGFFSCVDPLLKPLQFVEGVGSTYGPFGKLANSGFEPLLGLLLCIHYGDSLVYMNNPVLGCEQLFTSVSEYPESVMRLYPNPVNRMLNVEFDGMENPQGVITVMDMAGVVVLAQECNSTVTQLDVSRLKSGIYVIIFRDGNGKVVRKFVKM